MFGQCELYDESSKLIEIPYSYDVNAIKLKEQAIKNDVSSFSRNQLIKFLIQTKKTIRLIEVHNPISALIAESASVQVDGINIEYDGFWSSSLTDSTSKGKPDIEAVDVSARINTLNEVIEVTTKPIIYDADTGGHLEHFIFTVKTLERLGVSAVIIEDKTGLKKNSLLGTEVKQTQADIYEFSQKISAAKNAQATDEFMVIARIESLILKKGIDDSLIRAKAFIDAGADGIMIHSREKKPDEIFEFIDKCFLFKLFGSSKCGR